MASRGPGPGAYMLPKTIGYKGHDLRKRRGPEYSFGIHPTFEYKIDSPGPGAYFLDKINRFGPAGTPKYTMRPKVRVEESCRSPGPAAHDLDKKPFFKGKTAPAYSLRPKNFPRWQSQSPPPNSYDINVDKIKKKSPAFSMGIGLSQAPKILSPGPATYGSPDLNVKLRKLPAYSLGRRDFYESKATTPAPNKYNTSSYKPKKGYAYSFGVKHSDYAPPMVIECDNVY